MPLKTLRLHFTQLSKHVTVKVDDAFHYDISSQHTVVLLSLYFDWISNQKSVFETDNWCKQMFDHNNEKSHIEVPDKCTKEEMSPLILRLSEIPNNLVKKQKNHVVEHTPLVDLIYSMSKSKLVKSDGIFSVFATQDEKLFVQDGLVEIVKEKSIHDLCMAYTTALYFIHEYGLDLSQLIKFNHGINYDNSKDEEKLTMYPFLILFNRVFQLQTEEELLNAVTTYNSRMPNLVKFTLYTLTKFIHDKTKLQEFIAYVESYYNYNTELRSDNRIALPKRYFQEFLTNTSSSTSGTTNSGGGGGTTTTSSTKDTNSNTSTSSTTTTATTTTGHSKSHTKSDSSTKSSGTDHGTSDEITKLRLTLKQREEEVELLRAESATKERTNKDLNDKFSKTGIEIRTLKTKLAKCERELSAKK